MEVEINVEIQKRLLCGMEYWENKCNWKYSYECDLQNELVKSRAGKEIKLTGMKLTLEMAWSFSGHTIQVTDISKLYTL